MGRSRSFITPFTAVGVDRNGTSSTYRVGEASAYVQSSGLKAAAAVLYAVYELPGHQRETSGDRSTVVGEFDGMQDGSLWADLLLIPRYLPAAISVVTLLVTVGIVLIMIVGMCFQRRR